LPFGKTKSLCATIPPTNCRSRAEFGKFGFFCSLFTIHHSLRSRCRLAKQNYCAVQYRRSIADVEGIGELKLASSLITHRSPSAPHPSSPRKFPVRGLRGAYNAAKHHSKIAQRRAGGRAYNPAKHHSKIAQRRAGGPRSSRSPLYCFFILVFSFNCLPLRPLRLCGEIWFSCFLFPLLLSPVISENLIQNCQLNQYVVPSAPVFALYLQELQ